LVFIDSNELGEDAAYGRPPVVRCSREVWVIETEEKVWVTMNCSYLKRHLRNHGIVNGDLEVVLLPFNNFVLEGDAFLKESEIPNVPLCLYVN